MNVMDQDRHPVRVEDVFGSPQTSPYIRPRRLFFWTTLSRFT